MAYTLPQGNLADFQLGTISFPRPYNSLIFRQKSATYTPPIGNVVYTQFPTPDVDFSPPAGNAANFSVVRLIEFNASSNVTIDITAAGSGTFTAPVREATGAAVIDITASGNAVHTKRPMRVSTTAGRWGASQPRLAPLNAPSPAALSVRDSRRAGWGSAKGTDAVEKLPWGAVAKRDAQRTAAWLPFTVRSSVSVNLSWRSSNRRDDGCNSPWGKYGPVLSATSKDGWVGSRPADRHKTGGWNGDLIPTLRKVPHPGPAGNSANFAVIGGGIDCAVFPTGGYTPPIGNALYFQFDNATYRVPFMSGAHPYVAPAGNAVKFTYAPQYELILDGTGHPVLDKSIRDPGQLYPWGMGKRVDSDKWIPWSKYSRPMNPGWGIVTPGGPVLPTPGNSVIIPVKRVYIVVNEILLVRAVGNVPIVAENINVTFDSDSWLSSFSATIPESARDAVMPDPNPVEVIAFINGSEFRFFVEKVVRNRSFGKKTVSISGRVLACELDAPYATVSQHANTLNRTAQQLIDDALTNTTYTQTWAITDWLVPAGVFNIHGTPAAVAAAVATASGSVLQADWATRNLRMQPRYPVLPWNWASATPDYVIPASIAQTESIEWLEKPLYNVVYVSGERVGVVGQVERTGTAGDLPAPMVTHQLVTHADAARQRGSSILSDTGRKAMMQISMPVLPETGVIDVCRLIEFSDGTNTRRGIVRANNVSVNWPTVRQTLTIEAAV